MTWQVDSAKLTSNLPYLHMLWSAPLQLSVALYELYALLGPAGLCGLGAMLVLGPIGVLVGKLETSLTEKLMARRDKRVKFTQELLHSVRVAKLFAWEESLLTRLSQKRAAELGYILRVGRIQSALRATPDLP